MKAVLFLLCLLTLPALADDRPGNFTIRFEPDAKLQAAVEVPFRIDITDSRRQPLGSNAKVEMSFQKGEEGPSRTVKAWFQQAGQFVAKPVFATDGEWSVTVTARINDQITKRTILFNVVP